MNNMAIAPSMLLYRYLSADSAIRTIEGRAFRVSRILELNDPFEWRPGVAPVGSASIEQVNAAIDIFVKEMNDKQGCCVFP
jgi:hypothetical protein